MKGLSAEYYKRRSQLARTRFLLIALVALSLVLLFALSLAEGWILRHLIAPSVTGMEFVFALILMGLFLIIYCVVLARLCLHITYHIEHAGMAQTAVTSLFLLSYVFVFIKVPNVSSVLSLVVSKLFSTLLFFRFWQSQLSEARLQMRLKTTPRIFMVSIHAFFVCRWVIVACWLLSALGLAIALAATQPTIALEVWEGFALMGTFFMLFWAFVRNPNAHAGY